MADKRFARSVVYICAHSGDGAMGIVINKLASGSEFPRSPGPARHRAGAERAATFRAAWTTSACIAAGRWRPAAASCCTRPISSSRTPRSPIDDGICLTATLEILRAISDGRGPDRALLALGYAGWAPGQLEFEIQANGWLHSQADREHPVRRRHRQQIRPRARQDRRRAGDALDRRRPRLRRVCARRLDQLARARRGRRRDHLLHHLRRHRPAVDEALRVFAAGLRSVPCTSALGLGAFGDHLHAEVVRHA